MGRGVLSRFNRTIQSFYDRCKNPSKKAGFPRFKPRQRWESIEVVNAHRSMLKAPGERKNLSEKWWRLTVKGVPQIQFEDKRDRLTAVLENGRLVELRAVRTPLRVEIHAVIKHPDRPPAAEPVNPVGLELGLKSRLVTSDGERLSPRRVGPPTDVASIAPVQHIRHGITVLHQEAQTSGQTAPPHPRTGHRCRLPPGRPPGQVTRLQVKGGG